MAWLLDTNVVSEVRKAGKCDQHVAEWMRREERSQQYLSVISMMELKLGIQLAQRKNPQFAAVLDAWYESRLKAAFAGRVLPINLEIGEICARLHATRPRSFRDAFIGATALIHGLKVVTRNTADFEEMGLDIVNPWHG